MSDFFHQPELSRTASYMVLRRERALTLYRDLLARQQRIEKLERRTDALTTLLDSESNLLTRALHDLAMERGKEPRHFARTWLATHRSTRGGEARAER